MSTLLVIICVQITGLPAAKDIEERENVNFMMSAVCGLGAFEELRVQDIRGNPFCYKRRIAFPAGFSLGSSWVPGSIGGLPLGMTVGVSMLGGYFLGGGEVETKEESVIRKNFFFWREGYWGFLGRKKTGNNAFEVGIPVGESVLQTQAVVKIRGDNDGSESYELNHDEKLHLYQTGVTFRWGRRFRGRGFVPWLNFEMMYRYLWNRDRVLHRGKLMYKALAPKGSDDSATLYLFVETLRGKRLRYTQVGFSVSLGI